MFFRYLDDRTNTSSPIYVSWCCSKETSISLIFFDDILIFFKESARENEIIQLYEKMARENAKREAEIDEMRAR